MPAREVWADIPEFPNYQISSLGKVFNKKFDMLMRTSHTQHGHTKITLLNDDTEERTSRSVALLVAEAFVEPPNAHCDHVIVLDGNYSNIRADNLALRPRWFAWLYARQLRLRLPLKYRNLPILNETTGRRYESVEEAGMTEGLLFEHIWDSTYKHCPVYPYGHTFVVTK